MHTFVTISVALPAEVWDFTLCPILRLYVHTRQFQDFIWNLAITLSHHFLRIFFTQPSKLARVLTLVTAFLGRGKTVGSTPGLVYDSRDSQNRNKNVIFPSSTRISIK